MEEYQEEYAKEEVSPAREKGEPVEPAAAEEVEGSGEEINWLHGVSMDPRNGGRGSATSSPRQASVI